MSVTQISIHMPDKPGQLAKISKMMGEAEVNILALFVSTATPGGLGLMRFVPNDPARAIRTLESNGIEAHTHDVLAVETPHHAGGLLAVLNPLSQAGVNVQYVYPCIQTGESTILILGTPQMEEAVVVLEKEWIRLYNDEELYRF